MSSFVKEASSIVILNATSMIIIRKAAPTVVILNAVKDPCISPLFVLCTTCFARLTNI
jgi:hypothetical protein